jgi:hypothetical protein
LRKKKVPLLKSGGAPSVVTSRKEKKMDEITINGEVYIKKDDALEIKLTSEETVACAAVGMKVICRTINEGVNCGIVEAADSTGVILKNARRLWKHKPKQGSWYEGVSLHGLSDDSIVSCTVKRKFIIENYSLTECTDEAFESIMNKTPNHED